MENRDRNLKVFVENRDHQSGFHIYLGYAGGRQEYLKTSRHNGLLYHALEDGVKVEVLRKWLTGEARLKGLGDRRSRSRATAHAEGSIRQLVRVIDEFVARKEEEEALRRDEIKGRLQ